MLHLKDISLRPMFNALPYGPVDLTTAVLLPNSEKIYRGVPLILSGRWDLDVVQRMTEMDILSAHAPMHPDVLLEYYTECETHRTIFDINATSAEEIALFFTVRFHLADKTKMKYVRLNIEKMSDTEALEFVKTFRGLLPHEVGLIVGPTFVRHMIKALEAVGADIVAFGHHEGQIAFDILKYNCGGEISEVDVLNRPEYNGLLADVACTCPGDVAKAFALGADFVGIGPDLKRYTLEEIFDGLKRSCAMVGAHRLSELSEMAVIDGIDRP